MKMKTITIYREIRSASAAFTGLGAAMLTALVAFALPAATNAQEGAAGAMLEEIVTTARKKSDAEKAPRARRAMRRRRRKFRLR
jgi:hypothetical protein